MRYTLNRQAIDKENLDINYFTLQRLSVNPTPYKEDWVSNTRIFVPA